jgi:hypothetical protein
MRESDNTYSVNLLIEQPAGAGWRRLRGGLTDATIARFWAKVKRSDGCWLWTAATFKNGYGMFAAGRFANGKTDTRYAHRVAYELCIGQIPGGLQIRHSCDTPACCNPDHLRLGTQADNIHDSVVRGRRAKQHPGRWVLPPSVRAAVIDACLTGPRGTIRQLAAQHDIAYRGLFTAVLRERKRRQAEAHAVAS